MKVRIGKAAASFGKLSDIWSSKSVSHTVKVKLYETLIMSILLYSAELWPITVTAMKKLEAAHHRWQRKLLGITWKDKIKNDEVRSRTKRRNHIKRKKIQIVGT